MLSLRVCLLRQTAEVKQTVLSLHAFSRFLFHRLNHPPSFSHPSNGIREVEVFNRGSDGVRKQPPNTHTHWVLYRWTVGLIDVSVSDNLMEGSDNRKSH